MNRKEILDRCARSPEERVLLARTLDKLESAEGRSIPSHTDFLSPAQAASVEDLLRAWGQPRRLFWGGYPGAERTVCCFLPDWQEPEDLRSDPEGPVAAVEAGLSPGSGAGHRDILGSLMGLGIRRETLGDILLPEENRCQVVLLRGSLPILLSQWERAGRGRILSAAEIPLDALAPKPPEVRTIRDTVSALRLDAVLAAGFSLSRSKAAALIAAGRAAVNHRDCLKPDQQVKEGDILTCRGLGKCAVKEAAGLSRKGRTVLVLERYL